MSSQSAANKGVLMGYKHNKETNIVILAIEGGLDSNA
jgi:hypothetical protein